MAHSTRLWEHPDPTTLKRNCISHLALAQGQHWWEAGGEREVETGCLTQHLQPHLPGEGL